LADAHDSKSCSFWSVGSTPTTGIKKRSRIKTSTIMLRSFFSFLNTTKKLRIVCCKSCVVHGEWEVFMARRGDLTNEELKIIKKKITDEEAFIYMR
jgi:hypothetical protein